MKNTEKGAAARITELSEKIVALGGSKAESIKAVGREAFKVATSAKAERLESADFLAGAAMGVAYAIETLHAVHPWYSRRMAGTFGNVEFAAAGILASSHEKWLATPEGKAAREKAEKLVSGLGDALASVLEGLVAAGKGKEQPAKPPKKR